MPTGPVDASSVAPEQLLLAVGDVHGCYDLLVDALRKVDDFIERNEGQFLGLPRLVFVGDYVDRGERSADVLHWVYELQNELPDNVTCLMGNHERMMLEFLDDPAVRGQRWLRNGGLQTLASYRIGNIREQSQVEELIDASHALEAALPKGLLEWMRGLPLMHRSGNVCIVHAGMDPHLGPEDQSNQVLLWGHNDFMATPRTDGLWVVHGHTIVREPTIARSRISVDTGAVHSGKLTIAAIDQGSITFI